MRLIVLVDLHGVLGDVVAELLRNTFGADAVSRVPLGVPLTDAVDRSRPRVVITRLDDAADPAVAAPGLVRLFEAHPRIRVLMVEGDGSSGSLWELRPHRVSLGELSPRRLIKAIDDNP